VRGHDDRGTQVRAEDKEEKRREEKKKRKARDVHQKRSRIGGAAERDRAPNEAPAPEGGPRPRPPFRRSPPHGRRRGDGVDP